MQNKAPLFWNWLLAFAFSLVFAESAHADTTNPALLPLGEREAMLGNTGTALEGSSGGVFFNPAGLALVPGSKLSLSGSAYMFLEFEAPRFLSLDSTELDYKADAFNTLPSTVASVFKLGEWTLAFSALVPDAISFENQDTWRTTNYKLDYISTSNLQELWVGPSASRKLSERWSIGVSLYGIKRTHTSSAATTIRNLNVANSVSFSSSRTNYDYLGLVGIIGALYEANDDWNVGLRLQTPSYMLKGKEDVFGSTLVFDSGTLRPPIEVDMKGFDSEYKIPFNAVIGTWHRIGSVQILADLGYQAAQSYKTTSDSATSKDVDLKSAFRASLGSSVRILEATDLLMGLSYIPSAQGALEGNSFGTTREDFYRVTTGVTTATKNVETGVGLYYMWSKGEMVQGQMDGTGQAQNIPMSTKVYGILLTTNYVF